MGGNSPQTLVNRTCLDIAAGKLDVALVTGAEAWRSRMAYRKRDEAPPWTPAEQTGQPAPVLGDEVPMSNAAEAARGAVMPVQHYPMFETALRAHLGRGVEEHLVAISELWSRFNDVAVQNPYAWIREPRSAEQIRTPSPDNRMIGFPYTKSLNSNNDVDQSAALILCSGEAAERLGVPRDRWVFPLAGTDAHDTYYVSNRRDLHSSPAINVAGRRVLELAGTGVDDLAHVDLYSCFTVAVEVAAREIGLSLDRQLTVTGGLTWAGGPWNNYVSHGIATMAGVLREDPGSIGLCSANGGFLTKHAMGLYSTEPPKDGFRWEDVQAEVDQVPTTELAEEHSGPVTLESYVVMHERDGSMGNAVAACRTPDGRRTWAATTDQDVMKAMTTDDLVGRAATVADGVVRVD